MKLDEVIAKCFPFVPKNLNQSLQSEHGSLSTNLIGQNDYSGGMRLLRDSGSQF